MYYQAKAEIEQKIIEAGEQACFEANVHGLHPELIKVLGRLHYRTSYGQNVLKHSVECAHLAAIMAAELGASQKTARRAALLHDLGKAVTHEVEGPHAVISAQLAKRYRESPSVCHAIEAHHYDVEPQTVEAVLVIAADAVSASRPGGRGESLEGYIQRLEALEEIATSKQGVERCYAMQAGREIRVMVKPEEIDDDTAALMSQEIAREIEDNLEYPGQIKVTVIRESRAVEIANSPTSRKALQKPYRPLYGLVSADIEHMRGLKFWASVCSRARGPRSHGSAATANLQPLRLRLRRRAPARTSPGTVRVGVGRERHGEDRVESHNGRRDGNKTAGPPDHWDSNSATSLQARNTMCSQGQRVLALGERHRRQLRASARAAA